jgi:hypothetical protein
MGTTSGQVAINDPNGLTVNGIGGNDVITLINTSGNPLPNSIHLNGAFTLSGLSASNPLAGVTLDVGTSTVYVFYGGGPSPATMIQQYLTNGYNGGAWNGVPAPTTGVISSAAAAAGPVGKFGVGYVDSSDALIAGQPSTTVELRYTVLGDANLDRTVDISDALRLQANWNTAGTPAWDRGNFNFDAAIDAGDALLLGRNYGGTASGSVATATASSTALAAINATPANASPISNAATIPAPSDGQDTSSARDDFGRSKASRLSKRRR